MVLSAPRQIEKENYTVSHIPDHIYIYLELFTLNLLLMSLAPNCRTPPPSNLYQLLGAIRNLIMLEVELTRPIVLSVVGKETCIRCLHP